MAVKYSKPPRISNISVAVIFYKTATGISEDICGGFVFLTATNMLHIYSSRQTSKVNSIITARVLR